MKEKLIELIQKAKTAIKAEKLSCDLARNMFFAEYLIAHGVTVQEWISVKDRLPESRDFVLGYMSFGEYRTLKWKNETHRWEGLLVDYEMDFVTHWMPLPQPPKEGADNG